MKSLTVNIQNKVERERNTYQEQSHQEGRLWDQVNKTFYIRNLEHLECMLATLTRQILFYHEYSCDPKSEHPNNVIAKIFF